MEKKTAARARPGFRCTECGWTTAKWVGRCGECQAWGTVLEVGAEVAAGLRTRPAASIATPAVPIAEVDEHAADHRPTGIAEFDRVLGGGLVPGAVVLMAGEPGIGKSTLLLSAAHEVAAAGGTVLYVTAEESAGQVRARASRIGALHPRLYLAAETDLATVLAHVEQVGPDLVVMDSVQTVASAEVEGSAGNVAQVREVAASLIRVAKGRGISTLLVGHVTKDGQIAGPRVLEHLVDVVCQFEGDRHSRLRLLRAVKNRYGPTDEVGCFELGERGMAGLADPSGLFLSGVGVPIPGNCVTVTLEGRRPLVTEIQALVVPATAGHPRRVTSGVDGARVAMLLAVLQKRAGLAALGQCDSYASTVGGVRVGEPAADLATALAIASAALDRPLPMNLVAVGEVGLAGELRRVPGIGQRLAEAARLGLGRVVVPAGSLAEVPVPEGLRIDEAWSLAQAVGMLLSTAAGTADGAGRGDTAGAGSARPGPSVRGV